MSELFAGKRLLRLENGKFVEVDGASLAGSKVAIYFSAHWCPPCRMFTPVLKDLYAHLQEQSKAFEVVFVSSDRSTNDQIEYMKEAHGDWLTLSLEDPFVKELKQKYHVSGIPKLVVIRANGDVVTEDGRSDVMKGPQSYDKW
eukprot:Opistho-2@10664